jgi:hypothetical protein
VTLSKYIEDNYGGSQVAFAKANGLTKQLVWRMLDKGYWHVYEGMLLIHKRDVANDNNTTK